MSTESRPGYIREWQHTRPFPPSWAASQILTQTIQNWKTPGFACRKPSNLKGHEGFPVSWHEQTPSLYLTTFPEIPVHWSVPQALSYPTGSWQVSGPHLLGKIPIRLCRACSAVAFFCSSVLGGLGTAGRTPPGQMDSWSNWRYWTQRWVQVRVTICTSSHLQEQGERQRSGKVWLGTKLGYFHPSRALEG